MNSLCFKNVRFSGGSSHELLVHLYSLGGLHVFEGDETELLGENSGGDSPGDENAGVIGMLDAVL